jgi:hypothetical protein
MSQDLLRALRDEFAAAPLADLHHACILLDPDESLHETGFQPFHEVWQTGEPITDSELRFRNGSVSRGRFFGDRNVYRQYRRPGNRAAAALEGLPVAADFLARLPYPPSRRGNGFLAWTEFLYFIANDDNPRVRVQESVAFVWRNDWDAPDRGHELEASPFCRWLDQNLYGASAAALDLLLIDPTQTDEPAGGGVDDATAYRPAKEFLVAPFSDYKAIRKALEKNPRIRTRRPTTRRLLIHAGDWHEMRNHCTEMDPLDMPAEAVDKAVREVERRKAEVRNSRK